MIEMIKISPTLFISTSASTRAFDTTLPEQSNVIVFTGETNVIIFLQNKDIKSVSVDFFVINFQVSHQLIRKLMSEYLF